MRTRKKPNPDVAAETDDPISKAITAYSENVTRFGGSTCDQYVLIALADSKVREHFLEHASKELFTGARCPPGPSPVDQAYVLFSFRVLPPTISILPVYFLVALNSLTGEVTDILDPYIGPPPAVSPR